MKSTHLSEPYRASNGKGGRGKANPPGTGTLPPAPATTPHPLPVRKGERERHERAPSGRMRRSRECRIDLGMEMVRERPCRTRLHSSRRRDRSPSTSHGSWRSPSPRRNAIFPLRRIVVEAPDAEVRSEAPPPSSRFRHENEHGKDHLPDGQDGHHERGKRRLRKETGQRLHGSVCSSSTVVLCRPAGGAPESVERRLKRPLVRLGGGPLMVRLATPATGDPERDGSFPEAACGALLDPGTLLVHSGVKGEECPLSLFQS
jgi:hypothetical protein